MRTCFLRVISLLVTWSATLFAQWQSLGNIDSYSTDRNVVTLKSGPATIQFTALAPDVIRVHIVKTGAFPPDQSCAVEKKDWGRTDIDVHERNDAIEIATGKVTVVVKERPARIRFLDGSGKLLNMDDDEHGVSWNGSSVRVWKVMPQNEQYYGLGEKAGALDRRGSHLTMWNSDIPGYRADTDPLYQSIPFFYGVDQGRAYGIFFDNSYWSSFDMGKEFPDRYSFGAVAGEMNYYFFAGPTPGQVLERFTELVGKMPLPARWSLGYQQCRWSYYPESRVRKLAADFRTKRIPCDALYLDIDYMEGYRIFTWNKKNFPEPQKMISDLAYNGFKIVTIVDPGIKVDSSYNVFVTGTEGDFFLKNPDGKPFIGKVWPGLCVFPDFSNPAARQWWGRNLEALTSAGVRGFWNDMNEPSVFDVPTKTIDLDVLHDDGGLHTTHAKNHNLYGLQMTQATYEGSRALRPEERPFVLTRASYAGGWRYSAAWTGDNISTWEHLEMAVPMMLGLSASGQPFVGTDIGGFIGSPDGELYARWLELGVFSPLMRTHTAWDTKDQEPWSYGLDYEEINKRTIELRYRLLPYIYNAMLCASVSGIPPLRPLWFDYPADSRFAHESSEFMFGDALLVAPVLRPGERTRSLALPQGEWYDYWTGKRYNGGTNVTVDAPIDRIPLFAKAGSIIPSQQVLQFTDQKPIDPLTLTVFLADSARYEFYEDDGISFGYQKGVYAKRVIHLDRKEGRLNFVLDKVTGDYRYPDRSLLVELVGFQTRPSSVSVSKETLTMEPGVRLNQAQKAWTYSVPSRSVWVKLPDLRTEQVISVR